jgi:hypothetical protein
VEDSVRRLRSLSLQCQQFLTSLAEWVRQISSIPTSWRFAFWVIGLMTFMGFDSLAIPAKTRVQDTVFLADGSRFSGNVTVEWPSFTASDQSVVARGSITTRVINGVLLVELVPTTDASLGAAYVVRYVSGRNTVYTERWFVPPSVNPVTLRTVRGQATSGAGSGAPGGNTTITIPDVQNLTQELANRPIRGTGFSSNRALRTNATGQLESVDGPATDCVKVDGSAGPCGTGGSGTGMTFNGAPASNVVIGEELDWLDQGSGTFRVQVGAMVPRVSSGTAAPTGTCTPGHSYVTASTLFYCDANGGWKSATAGGSGSSGSATVFPATGWTARNAANVTWTLSGDNQAIIASIGTSDQPTASVYCRPHSGPGYDVDIVVLRQGSSGANLASGLALRSTSGYRAITLGQGALGPSFDVSGVTYADATFAGSGSNAAGQSAWPTFQVGLGIGDDGTNVTYRAQWQRGSEVRQGPTEICLVISGKPQTQVAFYNWRTR